MTGQVTALGLFSGGLDSILACRVVADLGVSPVHFAAIVGVNIGMGNITPPTAPLLYLSVQLNGATVGEALAPTLKLICFAWLPTLLLTSYFPDLALWLPRLLLGGNY